MGIFLEEFLCRPASKMATSDNEVSAEVSIHGNDLVAFREFTKFNENTTGGFRVNESDFGVMSTGSGLLVDQCRSLFKVGFHFCFHILHFKTDVVNSGALRL